jgi:uncharacterized membrane protein
MKKSTLVASAVASLFAMGAYAADKAAPAKDSKAAAANVKCTGVNECKGKGACAGAGNACAGKNECKGKGVMSMTETDCKAKGGMVAEAPKKK